MADYRPTTKFKGKIPSGGTLQQIELTHTVKVIDEVKSAYPGHYQVTFKYQENLSHAELMQIARNATGVCILTLNAASNSLRKHGKNIKHHGQLTRLYIPYLMRHHPMLLVQFMALSIYFDISKGVNHWKKKFINAGT